MQGNQGAGGDSTYPYFNVDGKSGRCGYNTGSTALEVDDYMMKPFNPEILKAKVENLILRREHLKRIYTKSLMLKQTAQETEGDDFMQKVINVIEANLANEDFSVQMLAERLNMSQPTLYRKIKERSENFLLLK